MMSDIDERVLQTEFKFVIGELVYFKSATHDAEHTPRKSCVYSQFAERCDGGIQRFYRLDDVKDIVSETVLTAERPEYEWADPQRALETLDLTRRRREQDVVSWRTVAYGKEDDEHDPETKSKDG